MRRLLVLGSLALIALAIPLSVAAATDDDIAADYAAVLADLGVTSAAPATGADVAIGINALAVTCPNGVTPPGFDDTICALGPRRYRFAGASNLISGDGHGVLQQESISRQTGLVTATARARIFCVTAVGNHAVVGGVIEESTGSLMPGTVIYVPMVDNGPPGSPVPDLVGPTYVPGGPAVDVNGQCTEDPVAFQTVTEGDVKVHDGQLVVTS